MTTLGQRIKSARKAKKMTQEQLGLKVGVKKASVSQWENGLTKQLIGENLLKTAKALGVTPQWLTTGEVETLKINEKTAQYIEMQSNAHETVNLGLFTEVPVVGCAQLGDNGHWTEIEYPVGHGDGAIPFPINDQNAYALRCVGDSMRPRIKSGEYVIIAPNTESIPGDEVLIKAIDGRVMIKTLLYTRDQRIHVMSINEAHLPQSFLMSEIDKIHTVAAIVKPSMLKTS
jgi:phage repressor protein C with HTH and peptisase S24 domain